MVKSFDFANGLWTSGLMNKGNDSDCSFCYGINDVIIPINYIPINFPFRTWNKSAFRIRVWKGLN